MNKKKNKKKSILSSYYFYIFFILLVFLLVCLISIFGQNNKKYDISSLIANNSYDVVYLDGNVPVINLVGNAASEYNNDIQTTYSCNDNGDRFEYEYDVSEDTFSLLLKRYIIVDNKEFIQYYSYIINLNTMEKMTYDDLLDKFEIKNDDLAFFIRNKFFNYYMDLLDANYFKGDECDFECFIMNCNFQDFMEDNVYYIKNNHLYLYKFFNIYTKYNYNDFFSYDSFVFEVK